ncbi:Bug family tripartite tricarboxylate transporter substrate binding protein [Halomonas sp. H2]|uniref:Bug family tripartite tricarboxylate transporter substrate binding protein n=1 Tax=Halomonas sp. H2 TaxID=261936 RepID=UPI003CF0FD80
MIKTIHTLGAALLAVSALTASADDYPQRPIQVIVPYSAGGGTDVSMRILAESMERNIPGATIVVRNQSGGGGSIGTSGMVNARPDGYTLGTGLQGPLVLLPLLGGTAYNFDDVTYIGMFGRVPHVLAACAGAPFSDYEGFIAYASEHVPQIANTGAGGSVQITTEAFAKNQGIKIESIPFNGAADSRTACVGGHVDAMTGSPSEVLPQIRSGNLTPILVMEDQRLEALPDTPTAKEKGIDFSWSSWKGLVAPKGVPDDILHTLRAGLEASVADEQFLNSMRELNELPEYEEADTFRVRAQEDTTIAEAILRDIGMFGMNK